MSRASDLANLVASGSTTIFGEAGVTSSDSTGKTTNLQQGLAKVWTKGDGSGTVGITDSLNTASMADEGTGDYTYNFTNSMGNTTYIVQGVATETDKAQPRVVGCGTNQDTGYATGSHGVICLRMDTQNPDDMDVVNSSVFGDLA